MASKNQLRSLTIRWQPSEGKPLAQVADWLNNMSVRERRKKVAEVCLMTLLPYALEANQKTEEEVERCYWEVRERLFQYLFAMKQVLGIKSENPTSLASTIPVDVDNVFQNQDVTDIDSQAESTARDSKEQPDLKDLDLIFGVSQ